MPSNCIQVLQTTHSMGPVLQNGLFSQKVPDACCWQPPCSPRLQLFPYGSQSTQTPAGQSYCMSFPLTDGDHAHSRYQVTVFVYLSSICNEKSNPKKAVLSFQRILNSICKQRHLALLESSRSKLALLSHRHILISNCQAAHGPHAPQNGLKAREDAIT